MMQLEKLSLTQTHRPNGQQEDHSNVPHQVIHLFDQNIFKAQNDLDLSSCLIHESVLS